MDPAELLRTCVPPLERAKIGYFVTGSVAASVYGEPRLTRDIDIVVHLERDDAEFICGCFPEPAFYISAEAVKAAIDHAGQFSVLHPSSGLKVDFMVAGMDRFDRSRFARTRTATLASGLRVRIASPEDVILKKLEYYKAGESDKHLRDIAGMIRVLSDSLDAEYLTEWAERLGVNEQWRRARARAEGHREQ